MTSSRFRNLLATSVAAALASTLSAQLDVSGTLSVGAGGSLLDGDRAAFQSHTWHQKDGFGGLEELTIKRETDDSLLKLSGRLIGGDDDSGFNLRWEKFNTVYVDLGLSQFRTYYDIEGGYIPVNNLWLQVVPDVASIDRTKMWFEIGVIPEDKPQWTFRYERDTREGTKGSTAWADTSFSTLGSKYIVPTFYHLDETVDTWTADVKSTAGETKWETGIRYASTKMDDKKNARRTPAATSDRYLTTTDNTSNDLFAAHGYVERALNEKVTMSVGGLFTRLDTQLDGTRIFGSNGYDPVYDPAYPTRQQRDEGYYNLTGDNQLKQSVANINLVYVPAKDWTISPSLRFEDLRVDNASEFIETAVGGGTARAMAEDEIQGESNKDWQEVSGRIDVRYTGMANVSHNFRAEWLSGDGSLMEQLTEAETGAIDMQRTTDTERTTAKYSYGVNYYAKPGLSFAAQAYYRERNNDFANPVDSTTSSGDKFPAYVTAQDYKTADFNVRMTWRPASNLTLVARYDLQNNSIYSTEADTPEAKSSDLKARIVSGSFTWLPTPRVYLTGSINVVQDSLNTPAAALILNGENDYTSGNVSAGYVVSETSDVLLDLGRTKADNYVDSSNLSVPYNAGFKQNYAAATWVYRASEHLVYHLRYSYADYTDQLSGGNNDYTAHTLYAKVQYLF